jgi:hypothetical protein
LLSSVHVRVWLELIGKTTLYRSVFRPAGYVHINLDTSKTHGKATKTAIQALDDKRSVVYVISPLLAHSTHSTSFLSQIGSPEIKYQSRSYIYEVNVFNWIFLVGLW